MATKKKSVKKKSTKDQIKENPRPLMQFLSSTPIIAKSEISKKKPAAKKTKEPAPTNKRYFMLQISGRGGEVVMGTSTKEFVEYWKGRDSELADHMYSLNDVAEHLEFSSDDEDYEYPEYYDQDSPTPDGKDIKPYFDYDDILHETSVSSDSNYHSYSVTEITLDKDAEYVNGDIEWKEGITDDDDFDWGRSKFEVVKTIAEEGKYSFNTTIYCRELFMESDKSSVDKPVPVVAIGDIQKGTFGCVYVETDGEDFDPNKLSVGVIENNMIDVVEEIFYGRQSLNMDTDSLGTDGKGMFATVGYIEKDLLKFNRKAWIKEGFKDLDK